MAKDFHGRLLARLRKEVHPDVSRSDGHDTTSYWFGFASVELSRFAFKPPFVAAGRKEGDPGSRGERSRSGGKLNTLKALVEWAVDILKTGRTVECGKGAPLPSRDSLWPRYSPCNICWDNIPRHIEGTWSDLEKPWDLNPDYQRGHAWTDHQAEAFIGHLLEGGQTTPIFIQRYDTEKNVPSGVDYLDLAPEVIDGQQRLRALYRFIKGEIAGELTDGTRVWYRDFNEKQRGPNNNIVVAYVDIDRETKLRFYLKLNRGGTVHTEEEIQRVRNLLAQEETNG